MGGPHTGDLPRFFLYALRGAHTKHCDLACAISPDFSMRAPLGALARALAEQGGQTAGSVPAPRTRGGAEDQGCDGGGARRGGAARRGTGCEQTAGTGLFEPGPAAGWVGSWVRGGRRRRLRVGGSGEMEALAGREAAAMRRKDALSHTGTRTRTRGRTHAHPHTHNLSTLANAHNYVPFPPSFPLLPPYPPPSSSESPPSLPDSLTYPLPSTPHPKSS